MLRPPMPVLPGTPLTVLGTAAKFVVPLPSWPDELSPQQRPVKLVTSTAQVCVFPVTTSKPSFKPNTAVSAVGRTLLVLVSPSWPNPSSPQQRIEPSKEIAQLCF